MMDYFKLPKPAIRFYVLVFFMQVSFFILTSKVYAQETSFYELKKNEIEIGLTGGSFFFLFTDLEVSLSVNRRMSDHVVLEAKTFVGRIRQLYLFEGNQDRYKMTYGGGALGINFGRHNKFFELSLGTAYYHNPDGAWGDNTKNILPVLNIGFKKKGENFVFRTGLGWPQGLYCGLAF